MKCVNFKCNGAALVWVKKGEGMQTLNGFFIVKISSWRCLQCGASYGGGNETMKVEISNSDVVELKLIAERLERQARESDKNAGDSWQVRTSEAQKSAEAVRRVLKGVENAQD